MTRKLPIEAQCPRCEAVAVGAADVEAVFGFRLDRGRKRPQSWCHACRSNGSLAFRDDRPRMGDRWATPSEVFAKYHAKYDFTVDLAAEAHNAKLPRYFADGLHTKWDGERGWCNPPYSAIDPWIAKATEADLACFLLPARVDRPWFTTAWDREACRPRDGWTVDFPEGRVRFEGAGVDPNWASMVLVWEA